MIDKLFSQPECYGFHFYLSIILLVGLFVCFLNSEAASAPDRRPTILSIYTMNHCPRCEDLKHVLTTKGKWNNFDPDYVVDQNLSATGYPLVVYSDKTQDHGEKVFKGKAVFPPRDMVVIYHYEWKE